MENTVSNHRSFRLPKERVIQLDALSEALGTPGFSATIGALLASAREQGHIGHDIPGVAINRLSDGIVVRFDEDAPFAMSLEGAAKLAGAIRDIMSGAETGAIINPNHAFTAKRRGSGFRIVLHSNSEDSEKTWSPDIALEFAELLEMAVDGSS